MQNLIRYFKTLVLIAGITTAIFFLVPKAEAGYVFNPFTKKLDYVNDAVTTGGIVGTSTANYFVYYSNSTTVTGTPFLQLGSNGIIFTNASGTMITSTNAYFTNVTTTNLFATNSLFINASSTNLFASALTFTTASGTSITSTNAFFTNLGTTNFSATNGSFTSLTTTNLFSTSSNLVGLTFTNASGTALTSTDAYFSTVRINTTTSLGSLTLQGVSTLDPVRVVSSTGAQLLAVKTSGQVVVGANSLAQTGQLSVETPTTNDYALTFTNGVHYTAALGRQPGTSGQMFVGGLGGTTLNLWAGGVSRIVVLHANGYVGINSSTPSTQFVVVGTSTFNGAILQTNLGDCDGSTQNVLYDLTTGQFSCGTDDNNDQRVGTSTSQYFTFYDSATTVTGTSWVTFSGGALTVTTNTNFIIVSSTSGLFGNASTTNFYIAGILRDSTGSAGNFGDILISTSTGNRWTNLGAACTPGSGDCTVVDNPSWFIVSGGTGCVENSIIIKDDSTYSCDPDFQWDRTTYPVKRLVINGDISFLNATGTIGYFSESVSTTNIYADTITTNNLIINNDVTVNNLIAIESVTVAASTSITDAGVLTNAAIVKSYPANREGEFLTNVLTDPPSIVINTAVANTQAFYSDDISRMLVCSNVTSTGAISLKNGTLTPVNTGNTAFYNNAGTLQTITANTLCGGATYAVRGCITTNGFHAVMCVATSTSPTVFVKVTTSSYTNDIANASNWRTANFTVATPTPSVISLAGVTRGTGSNTRYLEFVSSSTKVVPATFDFTVNPPTITPDNSITCTTGGSATIQNTRAYEGGLVVGNAGAPFVTVYSGCGASTVNGSYGASAPSLTGPDLFVTRCSVYSLNGQSLFRQYGYNGCEKP